MNRIFSMLSGLLLLLAAPALAADPAPTAAPAETARAIFAGGCFWCMEQPFDVLPGVIATTSGYIGGHKVDPSYQEVSAGETGHAEAVEILYDPQQVSYEKLLAVFWRNIDPTDAGGQFVDRGSQYRSGIFYLNAEQRQQAEDSRAALAEAGPFKRPIVTEIVAATEFYPAEGYHQNYYQTNPLRYKFYRFNSGRDQFLDKVWGKDRGGSGH